MPRKTKDKKVRPPAPRGSGSLGALQSHDVTNQLAALSRKWVLYLKHSACDDIAELRRAVPFLDAATTIQLMGSHLWLTYDTEGAARDDFGQVIGDDGPTRSNAYKGRARVYAYLAGPHGGITENT